MSSGANDCNLISDPAKDFYRDLDALFIDFELRNKKVVQFHVNSAIIVKLFDDTISFRKHIHMPDTSCKKTSRKFLNSLEAGIGTRKKAGKIPEEGFAEFDSIIVRREVIESKNHG